MIAFVDSSVALRMVLGQPGTLSEWDRILTGVASGLLEVECLRTIDRLRLAAGLSDEETALRREAVYGIIAELEIVEPTGAVLRRAAQPLPTPLGTLDAIQLATATMWRESRGGDLTFMTHDRALALAARSSGFRVLGV